MNPNALKRVVVENFADEIADLSNHAMLRCKLRLVVGGQSSLESGEKGFLQLLGIQVEPFPHFLIV